MARTSLRTGLRRCALNLELLEGRVVPSTIEWICDDGDWGTLDCWDQRRLPTATDDVVIDRPDTVLVTHSAGASTIRGLNCQEDFRLTGGTLIATAAANFSGRFQLEGGAFRSGERATITGPLVWTGGNFQSVQAPPRGVAAHGGLVIAGPAPKRLQSQVLENHSEAAWSEGTIDAFDSGTLHNKPGATLVTEGNVRFQGQRVTTEPVFCNEGRLDHQGGDVEFRGQGTFVNLGAVRVAGGALTYSWTSVNAFGGASFTLDDGALGLRASVQTFDASTTIQGTGPVAFRTDVTVLEGTLDVDGDVSLWGGYLDVAAPRLQLTGRLTVEFGTAQVSGTLINVGSAAITDGTLFLLDGSGLAATGHVVNADTLIIDPTSALATSGYYVQAGRTTAVRGYLGAAEFVLVASGALEGTGVVDSSVWNAGIVAPGTAQAPGALTITGHYLQDAAGELTLRLGGRLDGAYDRLAIGGGAWLDGLLTVRLFRDFEPQAGDEFLSLMALDLNDTQFAKTNLPTLGDGLRLDAVCDEAAVRLQVVTEFLDRGRLPGTVGVLEPPPRAGREFGRPDQILTLPPAKR